jgi:hypothetical protein
MDNNMFPLIIIMVISLVLTYVLIRYNSMCGKTKKESFVGSIDAPNTCPAGTTQYYNAKDDILCCDGQVVGNECMATSVCRISPMTDPNAPPYCSDYIASKSFDLNNSQIQNPDTGLCLGRDKNGWGVVVGEKCDGSQVWKKNELGQIVHGPTGQCLTRKEDVIGPIYLFTACSPVPEQTFTYDYKKNTLKSNVKDAKEIYLQDLYFNKKTKVLLEKMTKEEYKKLLEGKNYNLDDENMNKLYELFYSDVQKPGRDTLLSLQPNVAEFVAKVGELFGKKA